jgi:hypothetical protein
MILTRPPNGEKLHKRLILTLPISAQKKAAKGAVREVADLNLGGTGEKSR